MDPELMLLDEPTQGMGHEDVDRVTQLIKKVGANRTILMVEHNMNVVSQNCRHHQCLATWTGDCRMTLRRGVAKPPSARSLHGHDREPTGGGHG